MEQSENIAELAVALNVVQCSELFALTDKNNPFFKSKYADLSSVWSVIRTPLTDNGLSIVQTMDASDSGNPVIVTTLLHTSGQWIRGRLEIPASKKDPQGFGAAITYGRRYSVAAMIGVCPEDDDGEKAMKQFRDPSKKATPKKEQSTQSPATAPQINKIMAMAYAMWPKDPKKEVTLRAQAVIDWFAGHKPLTKWQASDLISTWPEAVRQFDLAADNTPDNYGQEPPPIGEDDIPY